MNSNQQINNAAVNFDIPVQAIISQCKQTGIYFRVEGESLEAYGSSEVIAAWRPVISRHKQTIIAELTRQPVTTNKPDIPVIDWCALSESQAIIELCTRLNISLTVAIDGRLLAKGNTGAIPKYVSDITSRYRGIVIAHLLELPAPDVSDKQDSLNIEANCCALDVTIMEYCAAAGHSVEQRERLLAVRRNMAPVYLLQNLCAFRVWLYAANLRGGNG